MTKGQRRAQTRRYQRKILKRTDLDLPNMSGRRIARMRYGGGIHRRHLAKGDNAVLEMFLE